MTIKEGDSLPDAKLARVGADGVEDVSVEAITKGRKVVIFAVPGAFTPTCHSAHVPSFIRTKDQFAEKGVDEIFCVSVNDPFVMQNWGQATGATEAGIKMLSDPAGDFAAKLGMAIENPGTWLDGRSKRYAMVVEDGTVTRFAPEQGRGCEISGGEGLLATL